MDFINRLILIMHFVINVQMLRLQSKAKLSESNLETTAFFIRAKGILTNGEAHESTTAESF